MIVRRVKRRDWLIIRLGQHGPKTPLTAFFRRTKMKDFNVFLVVAVMLLVACTSESFARSLLELEVNSAEMADSFAVYNGCGTNISPPPPVLGGGGMPLITITEGHTILAGKIETQEKDVQFIKIKSTIKNPSQKLQAFRVGDIFLVISSKKIGDLAGVGLRSEACAIYKDADRKIVKKKGYPRKAGHFITSVT